jgi:glycosyltransferase involved in cell wall biosynthesis
VETGIRSTAIPVGKNMKILYLSCHSSLEYDEGKLFTELGHTVFSFGAYLNPMSPHDIKRPGYQGYYDDHLVSVANQFSKDNLHKEMIDWADVIMVMHKPEWIIQNWDKMKKKTVVWRTIGQSVSENEHSLAIMRGEGMKIVRYSPNENTIPGYLGHDAIIRFYKDENEFTGYTGEKDTVITLAQSMKKRGLFCGYDIFEECTKGFNRIIYGPDNEDTDMAGGALSYEEMKQVMRENRVYFFTGTYPAPYTLNFIEAFMTGIPVVAIGPSLANLDIFPKHYLYEVDQFITNGVNGYISENKKELTKYVKKMIEEPELAKQIGAKGRETATLLFGKENIKQQWGEFFNSL